MTTNRLRLTEHCRSRITSHVDGLDVQFHAFFDKGSVVDVVDMDPLFEEDGEVYFEAPGNVIFSLPLWDWMPANAA